MTTITVQTPADLPTAACALLGFVPTDSLVVSDGFTVGTEPTPKEG